MMNRLRSLLCVVGLCACTGTAQPPAPGALQRPRLEANALVASDATPLPLTVWGDAAHPQAIVIALHGMGDYANAFAMAGPEWAARGIVTYAPDQRGFGRSRPRGIWAGGATMRRDLTDAVTAVRDAHPGVPVFILGESMGGAVALSALCQPHPPIAGVILVAPAVWGRADMPWVYQAALWLTATVAPAMTFTGRGLDILPSDNLEMLRAYARDPLVQKETRADAIRGLVDLMDEARTAPACLIDPPPILFLYGAHDQIVPAVPTQAVAAALGRRTEVHKFPDGYHMLMRDRHGDIVRKTVADWVLHTP